MVLRGELKASDGQGPSLQQEMMNEETNGGTKRSTGLLLAC